MQYMEAEREVGGEVAFESDANADQIGVGEEGCDNVEKLAAKANLTERQREILTAYRECRSIMAVAGNLGIRYDTTREHLHNIARKVGVGSPSQLLSAKPRHEGKINNRGLLELLENQGFACALSGLPLTPDTASLDHKQPISDGGRHDLDNAWWVHGTINTMKGTMTVEAFVSMCVEVAKHSGAVVVSERPSQNETVSL